MKQKLLFLLLGCLAALHSLAQYPTNPVQPSTTQDRLEAASVYQKLVDSSPFRGIETQNIGPTIMSGRVVDAAVDPNDPTHFFVAYATGGVWETINNGQSFTPIFDNNGYTIHCGALAVNWETKTIYVGTGEANSSRSSYPGFGIFKGHFEQASIEWTNLGLHASHHISRIVIHPLDSNLLYVAVMGNLFTESKDRGVYRSTDGGQHWEKALFVNENTGAVDLEINPQNPDQIMVAMWEKARRSWNFWESGEGSGVYVSSDKGETWQISSSLPHGKLIGRIGLSIADNGTCYALLDNQGKTDKKRQDNGEITKHSFVEMSKDSLQNLSDSTLNKFLRDNRFPKKYTSKVIKKMVRKDELTPRDLFDFLTDSNAALFDNPVTGAELYRSIDFGLTWTKTHQEVYDKVNYTYGYYFGTVHVNPKNDNEVYIAGVPLLKSVDGGSSFEFIGNSNVHSDHHLIWTNPNRPGHIINGNDGGINISYDGGKNWTKCNSPAVGQFYTVAVDENKRYNVYGGLQDNGVWKGPNSYTPSTRWHGEGIYPYSRLLGGDGMQIQIDEENDYVFTGYQFGHYYRIPKSGKRLYIHPTQDLKEPNLRWNWQTPILLSSHNPEILYMGSNKLHRSMNSGETFDEISGDLTNGLREGDVSYGTTTTISESVFKFGKLYVGTDDGRAHYSSDGGNNWIDISKKLPDHFWVKEVLASVHLEDQVYIVLNGHTLDNFESHVYCSKDNGLSWERIGKNLPNSPANTIIEDPNHDNIIYLGNDMGLFISIDYGQTFEVLGNIPPVAVHDLAIQKKHRDLVVGTHGRSIYKLQLESVYQYIDYQDSSFVLLDIAPITFRNFWGTMQYNWKISKPSATIKYFLEADSEVDLKVLDEEGNVLLERRIAGKKGYNVEELELSFKTNPAEQFKLGDDGWYYPNESSLKIRISQGEETRTKIVEIKSK